MGVGVYTQLHNFKRAFFKFLFLHLKNYIKKYVFTPFAYFVQKENRRMHQISWSCSTGSSEPSDEGTRNQIGYPIAQVLRQLSIIQICHYNLEDEDTP